MRAFVFVYTREYSPLNKCFSLLRINELHAKLDRGSGRHRNSDHPLGHGVRDHGGTLREKHHRAGTADSGSHVPSGHWRTVLPLPLHLHHLQSQARPAPSSPLQRIRGIIRPNFGGGRCRSRVRSGSRSRRWHQFRFGRYPPRHCRSEFRCRPVLWWWCWRIQHGHHVHGHYTVGGESGIRMRGEWQDQFPVHLRQVLYCGVFFQF